MNLKEYIENKFKGGLVSDPKHWAEYKVYTPAQLDKYLDLQSLYENASVASTKSFARTIVSSAEDMSEEKFKKEYDYWSKAATEVVENEKKEEELRVKEFEIRIINTIKSGASDRDTAIKWILQSEELDTTNDYGQICYNLGLPYSWGETFKSIKEKQ